MLFRIIHTGATHRFYESRRRLFLDSRLDKVEKNKKTMKRKELRKGVCLAIIFYACTHVRIHTNSVAVQGKEEVSKKA